MTTEQIPPIDSNQPGRMRRALRGAGRASAETASAVAANPDAHDALHGIGGKALRSTGIVHDSGRLNISGTAKVAGDLIKRPKETLVQLGAEVSPHLAELAWTLGRAAVSHVVGNIGNRNTAAPAPLTEAMQPLAAAPNVVAFPTAPQTQGGDRHMPFAA